MKRLLVHMILLLTMLLSAQIGIAQKKAGVIFSSSRESYLFERRSSVEQCAELAKGNITDYWFVNNREEALSEDITRTLEKPLPKKLCIQTAPMGEKVMHTITLASVQGGSLEGKYKDEEGWNRQFNYQNDILEGTELSIRATPDPNRMVDKWYYNNKEVLPTVDDPNLYILTVTEPATVYVTFKEGESGYNVDYSAGEHGVIDKAEVYLPSGITTFESGQNLPAGVTIHFTAKPDNGYEVDRWYINDKEAESFYAGKPEFETIIKGVMNVRVTFKKGAPAQHPVSWSIVGGIFVAKYKNQGSDKYTFIKNGDNVSEGTELELWVNPGENEVKEWYINGTLREDLAGVKETKIIIEEKTMIEVICGPTKQSYNLAYSIIPNNQGTITVINTKTQEQITSGSEVLEGTEISCQVAIPKGSMWQLEKWMLNGSDYSDGAKNMSIILTVDKNLEIQAVLLNHTSIENTESTRHQVFIQAGELVIRGLVIPTHIHLYNTAGELILSRIIDTTVLPLRDLPQGVYYLVVEGCTYKVIK